jgi:hypothetical protein
LRDEVDDLRREKDDIRRMYEKSQRAETVREMEKKFADDVKKLKEVGIALKVIKSQALYSSFPALVSIFIYFIIVFFPVFVGSRKSCGQS